MNRNKSFFGSKKIAPGWLCFFMMILFCSGTFSVVSAETGDDYAKSADTLLRSAERNLFNGKTEEAAKQLEEAMTQIEALKVADLQHKQLKSLESKHTRIKTQVDKKLGQALKSHESPPKAVVAGAEKSGSTQLPAGVKKRLKDIEKHLNTAERYVSKDSKQAEYVLQQADELFREIDKMYAGQFDGDHPDFAAVRQRYDKLAGDARTQAAKVAKTQAGDQAAKELKERQSAEWVPGFRAYLSYPGQAGHDPDKVVFVPGTSEPEKFADAQKRYEAFKVFYEKYRKTEFPSGKTWELEDLADRQAPERLAQFESGFSDRMTSVADDVEKEIDQAMEQLGKDNGWKNDKTIQPPIVDAKWMASIAKNVERAGTALGNDPKATAIRAKYTALQDKDKANRKIRTERTLFFPDIYKDNDAADLKKIAEAVVKKEKSGGKILRVSLYKDAWNEETVEEWTDTTRTKRRIRTSRMINAQVASKDASGVFLHTLYIARDKQSEGWGNLYGHIMWSELMLENNVNKDGKIK